ncbi:hypothetical protein E4T56_gene1873 [Termitomyces sp. T112]|nr:hypothetical protein E4T56_gene1873 [Termitomyces sp. T112]
MKAIRKEASQPGVSSLPERTPENPWKKKLTLVIPPRVAPKLDLPFEKVPALNEGPDLPVQDTVKSSLTGTRRKEWDRTIDKLWEATVPFSTGELLDVAPGLREAMIQKLTLKSGTQSRDPNIPRVAVQQQTVREKKPPDKVDVNDLPMATYFIADGTQDDLPTGAVVHQDCVATYLENIPPGEKPVVVDQGEVAVMIGEKENGEVVVTGYTINHSGFKNQELRDVYLQAFAAEGDVGGRDEKTLAAYLNGQLCQIPEKLEEILVQQESLELEAGVGETAQVFSKKYKPVARKVKPVLGTSPEEFRIARCITGDPLADMPQLDPNPPDFKPTGRYTAECKEIIDQAHGGGFL